jgi:3-(3-hydroxy-phenyl)propionate hydroxylase
VSKSRRRRQLAGTLCPNPSLPGGQRLDALLGDGFALITTDRLDAADDALLSRRGIVVLIAESGGELHRWLRRGHATAAIVRPDRTVMCAGRDIAAVRERLDLAPLQLRDNPER